MSTRRILHHGPDPTAEPVALSDRAVGGCWFELHRQGGCGAGELVLKDRFPERDQVEIGDWISLEYADDERWYLGRVEQRQAHSPAGVWLRLEGMGIELAEVFPGGFAEDVDGVPPHRFGRTDLFSNDPDYAIETFDTASVASDVVTLLLERYVTPATHIVHDPLLIESPPDEAAVASIKFRGEESVRSIVKQLALAARGASWGVDAEGKFFFLEQKSTLLATLREGQNVTSLEESRDREHLFNRLLLTGDYVYDVLDSSAFIARRSFRFRGNFLQPESRDEHGERRIRMWVPWLRTPEDALAFVREFFRAYAQPTSRFLVETDGRSSLIRPWEGRVRLEDRDGAELFTGHVETVRVQFDHVPRFRLELGPDDPRTHWPEPPEDERWELPETQRAGGQVTLTDPPPSEELSSDESSSSLSSDDSAASTGSSGFSSGESSETCPCSPETEFTFTLSGVAGGVGGLAPCGHFNRTWTLANVGGCVWGETVIVGGTGSYTVGLVPLDGVLRFSATPLGEGTLDCAEYTAEEVSCAGETEFSLSSSPQCSGWPATVTVTGG